PLLRTQLARQTNYPVSTSVSWNQASFGSPSFNFQAPVISSLSGGADAGLGINPLVTLYQYDPLNNLTCAVQKATDTTGFSTCAAAPATWRPRFFIYDWLSRLLTATNPESGTITFTYDNNGNV